MLLTTTSRGHRQLQSQTLCRLSSFRMAPPNGVENGKSNGDITGPRNKEPYLEHDDDDDDDALKRNVPPARLDSDDDTYELDPFPATTAATTDRSHFMHENYYCYYYCCCLCLWIERCVKHPACDHLKNHWKILALGQLVSLTLASAGAAQATLKLDCHLNAPAFTVAIYYFFLSWHCFLLISRHRCDNYGRSDNGGATNSSARKNRGHFAVETEEAPDETMAENGQGTTTTNGEEEDIDTPSPAYSFFFDLFPMHKPKWQYFIIALIDVEANVVTALSFRYTTLTSVTLFDNLAIPTAMAISGIFFARRFTWIHLGGVAICMVGVCLNIIQDYDDDKDVEEQEEYPHKLRGDLLAITGGMLYGINNVMVEVTIRDSGDTTEYLGSIGFFAVLIASLQAVVTEWEDIMDFFGRGADDKACNSERWWLLSAYVGCTVFSYMGSSRFFQISEATFFGLSLLTGDLWSVIFSVFAEGIIPHALFFVALVFVLSGMVIYEMAPSPVLEDRGQLHPAEEDGDDDNIIVEPSSDYNDNNTVSTNYQLPVGSNGSLEMKQIRILASENSLI
eukprot:scaffold1169_cov120-Cylindrotheca_fusiformis.AAC.34